MVDAKKLREVIPTFPDETERLIESIQERCSKIPDGTTEFQLRHFVVGSEPKGYGQFRQCVIELRSKVEFLERGYIIRERILLDLQELDLKSSCLKDAIEIKRNQLAKFEKSIELRTSERGIKALENELKILLRLLSEIPKESIDIPEEQYWEERTRRRVAINLSLNQPLSMDLVESVLNLPQSSSLRKWLEGIVYREDSDKGEIEEDRTGRN